MLYLEQFAHDEALLMLTVWVSVWRYRPRREGGAHPEQRLWLDDIKVPENIPWSCMMYSPDEVHEEISPFNTNIS